MTKNSQYWEKRIANNTWNAYNKVEERNRALLEMYQDASKDIREDLYTLGEKYSKDGVLSRTEMYRKNRLKNLEQRYMEIAEELGRGVEKQAMGNMQTAYKEVYKHNAKELDRDFAVPSQKTMNALLKEPWRGSNFSNRLWGSKGEPGTMQKLVRLLETELTYGLQTGKTVTDIAVALNHTMQKGFDVAHRLVRTETMHYLNEGALQSYRDAGVAWIQVWAAEDERTCSTCASYHGKYYRIDVCPILPFHPNCRCTILPVTDQAKILELEAKNAIAAKSNGQGDRLLYDKENDYSIRLSGYSKDVNAGLSDAAEKVAILGSKDGKEHMVLVDLKTGREEYYETNGDPGSVGIDFWNYVDQHKDKDFAFVHNHNIVSSLSQPDLTTPIVCSNIPLMIAVQNDGLKYIVKRTKGPVKGFYPDIYYEQALEVLNDLSRSGKITMTERMMMREKILTQKIQEEFYEEGVVKIDGRKRK